MDREDVLRAEIREEFRRRERLYRLCADGRLPERIAEAAQLIADCLKTGGTVFVFGNGGSAAEAQHFAAELVGRYRRDRPALRAIALTTDTSILTAQANDSGYASVFARQLQALARPGDVAVALTTSDVSLGHSENIREGLRAALRASCATVGLFSEKTKELLPLVQMAVIVPSRETSLIQEVHLAVLHLVSGLVEDSL